MDIHAEVILVTPGEPLALQHLGSLPFLSVPRAGEVIYHHNARAEPAEQVLRVLQVVHDTSGPAQPLQLYVVPYGKRDFENDLRALAVQKPD